MLVFPIVPLQQIEQNQTFDFAMTGADGKELEPLTGPGLTGLKNLGNRYFPSQPVLHVTLCRRLTLYFDRAVAT